MQYSGRHDRNSLLLSSTILLQWKSYRDNKLSNLYVNYYKIERDIIFM